VGKQNYHALFVEGGFNTKDRVHYQWEDYLEPTIKKSRLSNTEGRRQKNAINYIGSVKAPFANKAGNPESGPAFPA
jgi:hypothetical protein